MAAVAARRGDASDRPRGTDLIIRELATGAELNFGNVSEFAFTRDGKFLASVIDATDKIGNGVQLRNMLTGTVNSLDTDTANYERLSWTEKGEGLTVLKGKEDRAFTDKMYSIVGFTGFGSGEPKKTEFDPAKDTDFPKGFCDQRQPRRDVEREDRRIRVRHPRTAQAHHPGDAGHDLDDRFGRAAGHARRPALRRPPRTRTRRSTSSCGTGRIRAFSRSRRFRNRLTAPSATPRCTTSARRSSCGSPTMNCGR